MKFPFILREDHELIVKQQNTIIHDRENVISAQRDIIIKYENEIQTLVEQLTTQQAVNKPEKEKKPFKPAKLSYRSLAQQRSQETIKPPADSAAQLEERVKKEGGKV
jgi:hypothetical protein